MRFKSNLDTHTEDLDLRCEYEPFIPNTKIGAAKDYGKNYTISDLLLSAIFCVIVYWSTFVGYQSYICSERVAINFCRAFISNILLILELVGSKVVQTLLNPPQGMWH